MKQILFIIIFLLGGCVGALIMHLYLVPPTYPGLGDFNGDGNISQADATAACHEFWHGPQLPEYIKEENTNGN